jgi:protocatechuate 3,4-dioxygenase alpha subunit
VLNSIDDTAARKTLIAEKSNGSALTYRFDIVLQGQGETVFFEV